MSAPLDVGGLISLLESSDLQAGEKVKELVLDNLRSSKEVWLVNALVDSYVLSRSNRCLEIISSVSEPHDKHVFDRLLDHLRGPHRLSALTILATLVYKRPAWLHKVVPHQLLNQLFKCLKTDTEIPVLLSGLLVVTALLPVVPVTINQYLPIIFDVFGRLATLCLKPPAGVSELYRYHLQVGVYCLHHRLYGMFPYHFLTYLRNVYSRQEHQEVFEHIIKPMVDKLRLHPLLFTTDRQKEISRDRWKQKEVHDILVECAQFSLDLTEGSTSEMSLPGPQKMADHLTTGAKCYYSLTELMAPSPGSIIGGIDPTNVLNLQGSGIVTPPIGPGQDTQSSSAQGGSGTTSIQQGAAVNSPIQESDKTPRTKKRHSHVGLSLAGKLPTPTDIPLLPEGLCSVPPSPLKPEFTSEPPLTAQRMQAIRKLSFHQSDPLSHQADVGRALEKVLANADKFARPPVLHKPPSDVHGEATAPVTKSDRMDGQSEPRSGSPWMQGQEGSESQTAGRELVAEEHGPQPAMDQSADKPVLPAGGDVERISSITQLPRFPDSLDNQPEDTDREVTELTSSTVTLDEEEAGEAHSEGSDTPSHLPAHINTAESVAAFMKKVNRLRFNSINVTRDGAIEKITKTERSRSCPMFNPDEEEERTDNPDDHTDGIVIKVRAGSLVKQQEVNQPRVVPPRDMHKKMTRSSSSQTSLYALSAAMLDRRPSTVATETSTEADAADHESPFEQFPYQELFSMSLPFSAYVQCYNCVMNQKLPKTGTEQARTRPVLADQEPLFSSYSPVELLDRILDQGQHTHSQEKVFTSPGGNVQAPALSACTDVGLLRGHIDMLHNQLMFERHKRELHAQRNRRLLSRVIKTTILQEQNSAMKDQLKLQERELMTLRQELRKQQKVTQDLKQTTAAHETETEKMQKSYNQKIDALQNHTRELEKQLEEAKTFKDKSNKDMQSQQALVYMLTKEVEALTAKTQGTLDLQDQVKRLNKELLLMGELQQKYQGRLVSLNNSQNSSAHTQFLLDTYKMELNTVKKNLTQKTINAEATASRLTDSLDRLKIKDKVIEDMKETLETARDTYRDQIEAVEDKYEAMKKSHLALQTEFHNLHHQIGCMKAAEQRAAKQRVFHQGAPRMPPRVEGDVASVGAEGWDEGCSGREQARSDIGDGVSEFSAPASVGSVESAEEAVAMDQLMQ